MATQFKVVRGDPATVRVPHQPTFQLGIFIQEMETPQEQYLLSPAAEPQEHVPVGRKHPPMMETGGGLSLEFAKASLVLVAADLHCVCLQ